MLKKGRFYIDPELQFPLIGWFILLVTLQGLFVGWGFHRAILLAQQWERPDQAAAFFETLLLTIIPVVAFNFLFGGYLSLKIAAPLDKMRRAIEQVSKGNLEDEIMLARGELLLSHAENVNRMIQRLRHILYRDHQYVLEVNDSLTRCQEWLSAARNLRPEEREELAGLIQQAKSTLSIANTFFIRGKKEKP